MAHQSHAKIPSQTSVFLAAVVLLLGLLSAVHAAGASADPNPGGHDVSNALTGLAAASASNAWAVGYYTGAAGPVRTLALHWG